MDKKNVVNGWRGSVQSKKEVVKCKFGLQWCIVSSKILVRLIRSALSTSPTGAIYGLNLLREELLLLISILWWLHVLWTGEASIAHDWAHLAVPSEWRPWIRDPAECFNRWWWRCIAWVGLGRHEGLVCSLVAAHISLVLELLWGNLLLWHLVVLRLGTHAVIAVCWERKRIRRACPHRALGVIIALSVHARCEAGAVGSMHILWCGVSIVRWL